MNKAHLHEIVADPTRIYQHPNDVLIDEHLTPEEKVFVLEQWQLDAIRMETSESENMLGTPSKKIDLQQIHNALETAKKMAS